MATKAELKRALQAWLDLGLPLGGYEVLPCGTIRVFAPDNNNKDLEYTDEEGPEPWD